MDKQETRGKQNQGKADAANLAVAEEQKGKASRNGHFQANKKAWKVLRGGSPAPAADYLDLRPPRGKIDPLAESVAREIRDERVIKTKAAAEVRKKITALGIGAYTKRVTDRLNGRSMSDGRRLVLSAVYPALLLKLIKDLAPENDTNAVRDAMKDDLAIAEAVVQMLEKEDKEDKEASAMESFTGSMVRKVFDKKRITPDGTLIDIVARDVLASL